MNTPSSSVSWRLVLLGIFVVFASIQYVQIQKLLSHYLYIKNVFIFVSRGHTLLGWSLKGGPKEKNGLPDPRYLDIWTEQVPDNQLEPSNRQNWKQMQYTQHMKDLEAQIGGSFNLGGARAYLGCPVLVNHRHRLAYIKLQKTGSTSIVEHFTECGKHRENPETCFEWIHGLNASQVATVWRDYFVFSTVRNPFARAVSSFTFLTRGSQRNETCKQHYGWADFCENPASIGSFCPHNTGCCIPGPNFPVNWYMRHVLQQSRCLAAADGGWVVDYLLRTEQLSQDFKDMVAYINSMRRMKYSNFSVLPTALSKDLPFSRRTKRGGAIADFYTWQHRDCVQKVRSWFESDLVLLGK